ncbi:RDD family protein [Aeromicrobium sp. CF4.19]|uniref:RDD family protein n=1 Tax=Aeromicrobium sp. CF4.19 TaxID=3373082 RepID=UPI003EE688E1
MPTVSIGRRLLALLVDWVIALFTASLITGTPVYGAEAGSSFVTLGVFFVQVWLLEGLLGFTVGKRLLRMRVEGPGRGPIGLGRSAIRAALLCLVIPALIQNDDGRGFHDIAAGSRIAPT